MNIDQCYLFDGNYTEIYIKKFWKQLPSGIIGMVHQSSYEDTFVLDNTEEKYNSVMLIDSSRYEEQYGTDFGSDL